MKEDILKQKFLAILESKRKTPQNEPRELFADIHNDLLDSIIGEIRNG